MSNKYRQLLQQALALQHVFDDYVAKVGDSGEYVDVDQAMVLSGVWAGATLTAIEVEAELAKLGFHPRAVHEHLDAVSTPDAIHDAVVVLRAWLLKMRRRNVAGWGHDMPPGSVWVPEGQRRAPVDAGDSAKRLAAIVGTLGKAIEPKKPVADKPLNETKQEILSLCRRKALPGTAIAKKLGLSEGHTRRVLAQLMKARLLKNSEKDGYRTARAT